MGRVPPTALAAPLGGLRASPSFGGIGSTQSLGGRRSFRPLVGIGAQPFGGTGPGAIGAQPFSGRGLQTPSGGMGAGGGRGGRLNDRRPGLSTRPGGANELMQPGSSHFNASRSAKEGAGSCARRIWSRSRATGAVPRDLKNRNRLMLRFDPHRHRQDRSRPPRRRA
jgi:hypothetical protein